MNKGQSAAEFEQDYEISPSAFGGELLAAIEKRDGAEVAVILRELMFLARWDTPQQVAFRVNFHPLKQESELKWWTSCPV